jgi:hypothetical protein
VLLPTPDHSAVVKLRVDYGDNPDRDRAGFDRVVASLAFDGTAAIGEANHIQYDRLQALLAAQDWQAADLETRAIVMQLVGTYGFFYPHLEPAAIAALPCTEVQILDALWSRYSDGRYGFRAQQRLWAEVTGGDRALQWGGQVGWLNPEPGRGGPFGYSPWGNDADLTYRSDAPVGHLPWAGVSALTLERMIQSSGASCGTCTIDALYISEDRWADYLSLFMARVDECLCDDPAL